MLKKEANKNNNSRKKWIGGIKLVFSLYFFILMLELIKIASLNLAPNLKELLMYNVGPIKAISIGWFSTSLIQSSGAVGSTVAAFVGNQILSLDTAVYILAGAYLGTTITAIIISSLTKSKKDKDFRHGFEIGLAFFIYSLIIVFIALILEFSLKFFSKTSLFIASGISEKIPLLTIPNLLGKIVDPVSHIIIQNINNVLVLFFAFLSLIFILKLLSNSVINLLGGEKEARKFLHKKFENKYKVYFMGVLITAIVFSSSITISLLVPLAVARLIDLKKALPFIIGADLGTSSDLFIASILIGKVGALASFIAFAMFAILGAIIFLPNTEILFKLTKYTSKKIIGISRKRAILFLIAFILIPLGIIVIF